VSFQCEYVRCGKATCKRCPHGPYWYQYWREDGWTRKRYHGKNKPEGCRWPWEEERQAHPWDAIFNRRTATRGLALTILGLTADASTADVKKAYKALAMKNHPDRGGDERAFMRINSAFSYLV